MYEDSPLPTVEELEKEFRANPKLNLNAPTFYDHIRLGKSLATKIGYPLPPMERIIPLGFS